MVIECVDIVAWQLLVILVDVIFPLQTYNLKEKKRNKKLIILKTKMINELIRAWNIHRIEHHIFLD